MASGDSLESKQISSTYKDLLQVPNSNSGVDGTTRTIMDGEGTESALQVSTTAVKADGTFEATGATTIGGALTLGATALTSTATELNLLDGITAVDTDIASVSASDDTLASAKSIKTYVDAQILTKDNLDEIAEGTTNKHFTATDNTKLDGIETAATADQTGAQIKTAYEAESDTNAFTDAEKTKLTGVEASADVTDVTNVTAAGALMDSEVTNLAAVKAFDTADYATAAQGTTADAALAASAVSTFGGTLIDDANAAAARTTLGVDASGTINYTHPNHSGEITSTNDGATVVTDNVIDEANLKADNSPTNDYVLTAKSSAAGGLTWAASAGGGASALDDLTDVNIGTVGSSEDNYVLKYDHDNTEWIAAVDSTSGGAGGAAGDTGEIQFNSADSLATSSNLFWDNSNDRLGIGTAAPSNKLDVEGHIGVKTGKAVRLYNSSNSNYSTIDSPASGAMAFSTGGIADAMYIANDGSCGIGTAVPSAPLHVAGTTNDGNSLAQFTQSGTGRGLSVSRNVSGATRQMVAFAQTHASGGTSPVVHIQQADTGETALAISTDGSVENFTVSDVGDVYASGNCGIGTAAPDDVLHVATGGIRIDGTPDESSSTNSLGMGVISSVPTIFTLNSADLAFKTGGSERMRIGSAGQIGLGGANYGTANQVLTSNGDSAAPTWEDAGGSGDMTGVDLTAGTGITIDSETNTTSGDYSATITCTVTDTNTTYTAGDGLDLTGTAFSTDLKVNGGIVIESTELAIDLAASAITGTLADGDIASASTWNAKQDALTFGITDGAVAKCNDAVTDDDFLRINGTEIEGRSASEVLSDIGASASAHNHSGTYEPADGTILKDADIDSTVQAYDADTAKTDVAQTFTKPQRGSVTTIVVDSTTYAPDFSDGNNFTLSMASSASYNLSNPTNPVVGQCGIISIYQTNGGSMAYGTHFKFVDGTAPSLPTGTANWSELVYYVEKVDGANTRIIAALLKETE